MWLCRDSIHNSQKIYIAGFSPLGFYSPEKPIQLEYREELKWITCMLSNEVKGRFAG